MRRILILAVMLLWPCVTARGQWSRDHVVSTGSAGKLANPWRPTNVRSHDPKTFGLTDGPVGKTYLTLLLPDGRAAVVYEQTVREGKRFVNYLFVRSPGEGKWIDVVEPRKLRDYGEPDNKRMFLRKWGTMLFPMGYMQYVASAVHVKDDGTVRLLMGWHSGSTPERTIRLDLLEFKDGKWIGETTLRSGWDYEAVREYRLAPGPKGQAGFAVRCVQRRPGRRIATPRIVIRLRQGAKWRDMDWAAPRTEDDQGPKPGLEAWRLWLDGPFPLLVVGTQQVRQHGGGRHVLTVGRYLRWDDGRWRALWQEATEAATESYGLPVGRDRDGMPVWVAPGSSGESIRVIRVVEGEFKAQPLGKMSSRAVQEFYPKTPRLSWDTEGRMVLSLVGRYRAAGQPVGRSRLYIGAWRLGESGWQNLTQGSAPPYRRPFHGGHDGITSAQAVVGADKALLVWQNPLPIHGPDALFAAWAPTKRLTNR